MVRNATVPTSRRHSSNAMASASGSWRPKEASTMMRLFSAAWRKVALAKSWAKLPRPMNRVGTP